MPRYLSLNASTRERAQPMFDSYRLSAEFLGMRAMPPRWGKGGAPEAVLGDSEALATATTYFSGK